MAIKTAERVSVRDLRDVDIFARLTADDLAQIADYCTQDAYEAGEYCAVQGEATEELHIVNEGKVAVGMRVTVVPYTKTVNIATLSRGKVYAWSALVEPNVLTASVKCIEKTRVISIKASDLQRVFKERLWVEAIVMKNLAVIISSRLRDSRAQLVSVIAEMIKQGK